MHAVVLLEQILDWELPPQRFRIEAGRKRPPEGLAPFEPSTSRSARRTSSIRRMRAIVEELRRDLK